MEATLHDIVNALMIARGHAEVLGERYPEYQAAILQFNKETYRAQKELILKVRPELSEVLSEEP